MRLVIWLRSSGARSTTTRSTNTSASVNRMNSARYVFSASPTLVEIPPHLTLSCRPRCRSTVGTTNKFKSHNRTPSSAKPNGSTRSSSEVTPHLLRSTVTPKHMSLPCPPPQTRLSLPLLDARNARPLIHLSCILSDQGLCVIVVGSIRSFQRTGSHLSLCCDIPSIDHSFLSPCVVVLLSLLLGSGSRYF